MKSIGVIDCYMISPAIHCFNHLVESLSQNKLFYHLPGQHHLSTLGQANHDAYIILGSASHVHQSLPWHLPLAQFIDQKLKESKPTIGCCFGHQLMSHFYGSEIDFYYENEDKISQTRTILIDEDLGNITKGTELMLGVTHRQIVKKLSPCFKSISKSSDFKNDVIIHKELPFLGIQAHPEASDYFLEKECLIENPHLRQNAQHNGLKIINEFLKINHLC